MLKVVHEMGLLPGVREGYIVGSNTIAPSTGSYIFYKTAEEIMQIIESVSPGKPKGAVKGSVLNTMCAHRIKILNDGMIKCNQRRDSLVSMNIANSSLYVDVHLQEINSINDFRKALSDLEKANNATAGAWEYAKKIREMPEFLANPNLTDEHMARGYAIACTTFVMKE
jgi:hypothetical protein